MKLAVALLLVAALGQDEPKVVLVRVHGNHSMSEEDVLEIAGVERGAPFAPGDEHVVASRLVASGRFETAEVRVRYRSLSESGDVALILLVREKRSITSRFMVAPLFELSDEYGVTIGGRFAVVGLGEDGLVSFPVSFGGERQVGAEARIGSVRLDLSRDRQVNPHFEVPDNRLELGGGYTARVGHASFDVRGRWDDVDFMELDERFVTFGAKAALDTRIDPTVPGDAVYVSADWRRLLFVNGTERPNVNQYSIDLRGYKRLVGQSLLASQFFWTFADGSLPPYEQPFVGGGATLRGHAPGKFIGDNAALGSIELRLPISSPLDFGSRQGVHVFYDTGAVYQEGESLGGARFHHGIGTGFFFRFAFVGIRADVGWDLEGGTRFHFGTRMKF